MDPDGSQLIIIALLILAGGFFAGTETAFSACSRVRLMAWADDGKKSAKRALRVLEKFDKAIITLLIGNNTVHVVATAMATTYAVRVISRAFGAQAGLSYGSLAATVVLTLLVFFFSETLPKNIAKANADEAACFLAGPLSALMVLLTPLDLLFMGLQKLLRLIFRTEDEGPSMTEDDFTTMIETIEDEGVLEAGESELIQSAVEFTDRTVSEILTPRVKMVGLDLEMDDAARFAVIVNEKYTRLPVYRHDADHIVGMLNTKQYLQKKLENPLLYPRVEELMAEPYFVSKHMTLHELVEEMRRRQNHIAVVVDEWGGTDGIVTLEDALEELVGEIWDEDETKAEPRADALSGEVSE